LPVSFSLCFEHGEHWERIASRLETGLLIPSAKSAFRKLAL